MPLLLRHIDHTHFCLIDCPICSLNLSFLRVEEEAFKAAALIIVLRLGRVLRRVRVRVRVVLSSKARSDRQLEDARSKAKRIIHKRQDGLEVRQMWCVFALS